MNSFIFCAFLVADISALTIPSENSRTFELLDERFITSAIASIIHVVRQTITDAGLDPLYINKIHIKKTLPVPVVFNAEILAEEIRSDGLSNIVVHKFTYNLITSRLHFDIELPLVQFSVETASAEATLFGYALDVKASGKIEFHSIRIVGEMFIDIDDITTDISVRHVYITFTLGDITSDVKLIIQGQGYSDIVNKFLGSTLPNTIKAYNSEIDQCVETILLELINEGL